MTADSRPVAEPAAGEHDVDPRWTLANERTYLAWNRTCLAFVAGAIVILQAPTIDVTVRRVVAVLLALVAMVFSALSYRQWVANDRGMREHGSLPPTPLPVVLATVVSTLGLVVVALLVLTQR